MRDNSPAIQESGERGEQREFLAGGGGQELGERDGCWGVEALQQPEVNVSGGETSSVLSHLGLDCLTGGMLMG